MAPRRTLKQGRVGEAKVALFVVGRLLLSIHFDGTGGGGVCGKKGCPLVSTWLGSPMAQPVSQTPRSVKHTK